MPGRISSSKTRNTQQQTQQKQKQPIDRARSWITPRDDGAFCANLTRCSFGRLCDGSAHAVMFAVRSVVCSFWGGENNSHTLVLSCSVVCVFQRGCLLPVCRYKIRQISPSRFPQAFATHSWQPSVRLLNIPQSSVTPNRLPRHSSRGGARFTVPTRPTE